QADVITLQFCLMGQLFLGKSCCDTPPAQDFTERQSDLHGSPPLKGRTIWVEPSVVFTIYCEFAKTPLRNLKPSSVASQADSRLHGSAWHGGSALPYSQGVRALHPPIT